MVLKNKDTLKILIEQNLWVYYNICIYRYIYIYIPINLNVPNVLKSSVVSNYLLLNIFHWYCFIFCSKRRYLRQTRNGFKTIKYNVLTGTLMDFNLEHNNNIKKTNFSWPLLAVLSVCPQAHRGSHDHQGWPAVEQLLGRAQRRRLLRPLGGLRRHRPSTPGVGSSCRHPSWGNCIYLCYPRMYKAFYCTV